jgi:hypothetical protein
LGAAVGGAAVTAGAGAGPHATTSVASNASMDRTNNLERIFFSFSRFELAYFGFEEPIGEFTFPLSDMFVLQRCE